MSMHNIDMQTMRPKFIACKFSSCLLALPNLTCKLNLRTQVFGSGSRNFPNLAPIFWGRTNFMYHKLLQTHLLALQLKKIDTSPIFVVPKNYVKFDIESGTTKNGDASIFFELQHQQIRLRMFSMHKISSFPKYGGIIPNRTDLVPQTKLSKRHT